MPCERRSGFESSVVVALQARSIDAELDPQLLFGDQTIGPILAEACVALWRHLDSLEQPDRSVALFCARGGLRLKLALDSTLRNLGLPLAVKRKDFMTSRIAAAKCALLPGAEAAIDEIMREYNGRTIGDVVRGFGGDATQNTETLDQTLERHRLLRFMESGEAQNFRQWLSIERSLFAEHIKDCAGAATHLILVDTGLYGSTLRLMMAAFPDYEWRALLLARSNYKGFDEAHFARTTGLWVERNGYSPFQIRSSILRYWQLVEAILEPNLESVTSFKREDDRLISNLEVADWVERVEARDNPLFAGAMNYIEDLKPNDLAAINANGDAAWRRLRRMILFPRPADISLMSIPDRSRDFGIDRFAKTKRDGRDKAIWGALGQIKRSAWKEGAAAETFPKLRTLSSLGFETIQIARFLMRLHKQPAPRPKEPVT
jgi:hypothetical protein